jgi:hypothetical protein
MAEPFKRPPRLGRGTRFSIDLTAKEVAQLESLMRRTGAKSKAEIVRYCVRFYDALMHQQDDNPDSSLKWVKQGRAKPVRFPEWGE